MTFPIDAAAEWYDSAEGLLYHIVDIPHLEAEGKRPVEERREEAHTIDDRDEPLRHLKETHRLEFPDDDDGQYPIRIDHQHIHEEEAKNAEWDERFRPDTD